ncbi:MAG: gamma-glutamyl-gamma-aminobutyrate hydrolase family protein [Clostridia bacterium]|nr:gamma-glutamyl-gamma-aminobutyrate hydrolase family protein [Clostridia bacterium]
MNKKILVLGENPPISYLSALKRVSLDYDCKFLPEDYSAYGGLLLTGGGDVLPYYYGKSLNAENVNFIRDHAEFKALKYFTEHSLPIFGVCRGLQVLNVFFGGTLKCVKGHFKKDEEIKHGITNLLPLPFPFIAVNSYHLQAIDKTGEGGKVLLTAPDGVIEAVSFNGYASGVQFHPEKADEKFSDFFYGAFAEKVKRVFPKRKEAPLSLWLFP